MLGWISLGLGIVIVLITMIAMRAYWLSLQRVKRKYAVEFDNENLNQIVARLVYLETEINDVNEAYYNIVADLEGKYSIHEKEISIITERLNNIESALNKRIREDINVKSNKFNELENNVKHKDEKINILDINDEINDENIRVTEKSANEVDNSNVLLSYKSKKSKKAKKLRREGWTITDIAREIGAGIAETELLLKMDQ